MRDKKKILITGGSGFIGNNLIKALEKRYQIESLGRSRNTSDKKFYKITKLSDIEKITLEGVDCIVHCAAATSTNSNTDIFLQISSLQEKVAELAKRSFVKKVIFISSLKVNGEESLNRPFNETDKHKPEDDYARSKSMAESFLINKFNTGETNYIIVRPPAVYGPGMKGNLKLLFDAVEKGIPMPFGEIAKNRRSILSVYNLCHFINLCIENPNANNKTFLISDDNSLSTRELIDLIAESKNIAPKLIGISEEWLMRIASILFLSSKVKKLVCSLELDSTFAKTTLGWNPLYSTKQSLNLMTKQVIKN